jgi:hypothetical protein
MTAKEDKKDYAFKCIKCGKECGNVGNYLYRDHCIECGKKLLEEKRAKGEL